MAMVNLDQHDKRIVDELHKVEVEVEKVEVEVEKVEAEMKSKTISSNKAILIQSILLVITLLGIAVTAERRLTAQELQLKAEIEARQHVDNEQLILIRSLQDNQLKVIENQARVIALLETIDKRHAVEDSKK